MQEYIRSELGVSPNDPNTPVVVSQSVNGSEISTDHILSFIPGAPPSTIFDVPFVCGPPQEKKHMHHSPQLVMHPYMLDLTGERFKSMPGVGKS